MTRVAVDPTLLRWARERAGRNIEGLSKRFPRLEEWEAGDVRPTLKQLQSFARAMHVPFGYLFLPEPPEEEVPIPDLRTMGSKYLGHPSPDLLDTIYLCQRRQAWYRDGKDTKSAQMFTLAHELAHLWLGESALTDASPASTSTRKTEVWCNAVAAELLVPLAVLREELARSADPLAEMKRLARRFKVSTLVILRRLLDAGHLDRARFREEYEEELARLTTMTRSPGGDFYLTQAVRLSRRFARALIVSTLEGQTLYRDAFQMLGVRKQATFRELGDQLGLPT